MRNKKIIVIYASTTLDEAQLKYSIPEKEMFVVALALSFANIF